MFSLVRQVLLGQEGLAGVLNARQRYGKEAGIGSVFNGTHLQVMFHNRQGVLLAPHANEAVWKMREHTIEHRVRYDECDPMGFVHHSVYLQYFEIGRTELLRASGGRYRDMEAEGVLVVVVRVDCQYKYPARYDELIEIHTKVDKVTPGKIVHQYTVKRDERLIATATVTLAMVDRTGKLQRVPQSLVDFYGSD